MDLSKPLAYRMRPTTLDEYVGQEHILTKIKAADFEKELIKGGK